MTVRQPKRIMMMCTSPRTAVGGMERVFSTLAAGLTDRGHHVVRIYNEDRFQPIEHGVGAASFATLRTWHRIPTPRSVMRGLSTAAGLARLIRAEKPDVINFHFLSSECGYPVALRPYFGYRVVLSAHGSDLMRIANAMDRFLVPHFIRRADAVTVVSTKLQEACSAIAGGASPQATVIPNGVEFAFWQKHTVAASWPPLILTVGRLEHIKGHDVLLRAFALVVAAVPDARLRIIGEGSERSALTALADALGLTELVTFAGEASPDDIAKSLSEASVFVLPSRSEGQPLSLLEAMASGVPSVATCVGGVPEILTAGGILVPSEDPTRLAEAIIGVIAEPQRRAELAAAAVARSADFEWTSTVDAYEAVLCGAS